jgi:UDP-N-acetylglucosamine 2-epimerase (non-hydrolysing)/GDP/UDP-N,N'-diacetylbacillosamine 2-epimerase (hydrolysing)
MRSILYVTGSRADYGPARSMLKAISEEKDFSLSILCTGMHLDPIHGETWKEIDSDGFNIADKISGRVAGDSLENMAESIGNYLIGFSKSFSQIKPDIVIVLGDRGEMLAATIAAAIQRFPVVHLCGGTISGSIDDSIRHAITKFAHYHLVSFQESVQRVIQMGEDPKSVFLVGLPGSDLKPDVIYSKDKILEEYSLPKNSDYFLVIQHPVTHSQDLAAHQMIETLEALINQDYPTLIANPNDDAGGRSIINIINTYSQKFKNLHQIPPPSSRQKFASIMAHSSLLIGNSSSATVEAMSVRIPVVNIGNRQKGREHLSCWINTNYDRNMIAEAINRALYDEEYKSTLNNFVDNHIFDNEITNCKIINILKTVDLEIGKKEKIFFLSNPIQID